MGAIDPRDKRQDAFSSACHRIGRMAILSRCGCCKRPVVGVVMPKGPGRYSIECKNCGYSATSHFSLHN